MKFPRRVGVATIALAVGVALMGGAAVATPLAHTTPAKPVVVTGAKAGPVDVPGSSTFGTLATLKLTKGAWAVVAKGFLSNDSASAAVATCQLVAGSDSNRFQAAPVSGGSSGSRASFLLTVGHVFAAAGSALLRCESTAATGDVKANRIRMTAVKAGTLTDKTIGGSTHTSGSGIPVIVTAHTTAPVDVSGSNTLGSVATVQLPKGPWFVMADLWALDTASAARVECDLSMGSDTDQSEVGLGASGAERDREPMGLSVVHAVAATATAKLQCDSTGSTGDVTANDVRITAIKAGKLSNLRFGAGTTTAGTGIPVISSVRRDGAAGVKGANGGPFQFAKVASYTLPAGKWALVATAWVQNFSAPNGTELQCKLEAGSSTDIVHVIYPLSSLGTVDGFELATVHTFSSGGTVTLLCGDTAATDQLEIQFTKITAIKAGTLSTEGL
jgi:hypothetical protein